MSCIVSVGSSYGKISHPCHYCLWKINIHRDNLNKTRMLSSINIQSNVWSIIQ